MDLTDSPELAPVVLPDDVPQAIPVLEPMVVDEAITEENYKIPEGCKPSAWFGLERRPYLQASERHTIAAGARHLLETDTQLPSQRTVYHVDFCQDELVRITDIVYSYIGRGSGSVAELVNYCQSTGINIPELVGSQLSGRNPEDIKKLCTDILHGKATRPGTEQLLSVAPAAEAKKLAAPARRNGRVASLLLARQLEGKAGFGRMRQYTNFRTELTTAREDDLDFTVEFTGCAGDIAAMSWVSNDAFIAGTTTHSDEHNQQYNKPGNMLLCSATQPGLQAYPDHRIPRPLVEKGDNSTEAMRQSQDPWLYSSVVSSDYDETHCRAFTSSFDKTVKVWEVEDDGSAMKVTATWHHDGNVNFVCSAKDGSGRVATASDVPSQAVRVYTIDKDVRSSSYQAFSCSRTDANDSAKWAYYPATMQWGRAPGTEHLLAVGYSPRALSGDDHDIPEDKRRTGEIALWDTILGRRVPILTASTANVFEILWHPDREGFIAATTRQGLSGADNATTQTQIRLFHYDHDQGAYTEKQSLDCPARDINELTVMPNSAAQMYITAACTDGKVYVWDTALGDRPIHVLQHGEPVDAYSGDREREDTGCKFTAWGASPDRFYTGGSDGKVCVWNVRNHVPSRRTKKTHQYRPPLVRVLLEAPAPISVGAFSPDMSRLAIGDATGRVFLFALDGKDKPEPEYMHIAGMKREVRRPRPYTPHAESPPPQGEAGAVTVGEEARRTYLDTRQLVLTGNPVIGAVQGPEYHATGLFRREAHLDDDPAGPLMPVYERQQRECDSAVTSARRSMARLQLRGDLAEARDVHERNRGLDFDPEKVEKEVMMALLREGAEWQDDDDGGLVYEEPPEVPIW